MTLFRDLEAWKAAMRWTEIKRMMALNGNLFVRSLCFMVVYVGFTSLASRYGDTELAVSSILMKFFMFFSFFVDGFAYAGEALVGKAFGEVQSDQVQSDQVQSTKEINAIVKSLFRWSLGVGLFFTAVYALLGEGFIQMMTSDKEVLEASRRYMGWLIAMPIVSALAFMWDGVYVGATAGKQIRDAMIWAAVAFVAVYGVTYSWGGVQALYMAYFAHLIARVVYLTKEWKY